MNAMTDSGVMKHRLTVDEYYRMAEVGLLAPDARVELIDGEIVVSRAGNDLPVIERRHDGVTVRRGLGFGEDTTVVGRAPREDHLRTVPPRARDLHARRRLGHHDHRADAEQLRTSATA